MSSARDSDAIETIAASALTKTMHRARIRTSVIFSLAPGPHPRRELKLMPRLGFPVLGSAWPQAQASSLLSTPCTCRAAARDSRALGHEHPDHAVLPRREEQLAVAAAAKVQVGTGHRRTHRLLDQLAKRDVCAIAARVAHKQLYFLDRRNSLRNPIVCLLHRGSVGRKNPAWRDVPDNKSSTERGDAPVVRKSSGYRLSFTVVVNRHWICKAILLPAFQYVGRKRVQLVEGAARPGDTVLPISLPLHPAVVLAVANDVDLFDVVHPDIGREHRPVGHVPRQPVGVSKTIGVDLAECFRITVGRKLVGRRNRVVTKPLRPS